jgi:hypothetical protein
MARTIIGGYTGYNFRDHDLVFDKLSRLYEVAGFLKANGRPDFKKISYKSGVPIGTLLRWDGSCASPSTRASRPWLRVLAAAMRYGTVRWSSHAHRRSHARTCLHVARVKRWNVRSGARP